jgi:hypothetical protein
MIRPKELSNRRNHPIEGIIHPKARPAEDFYRLA